MLPAPGKSLIGPAATRNSAAAHGFSHPEGETKHTRYPHAVNRDAFDRWSGVATEGLG